MRACYGRGAYLTDTAICLPGMIGTRLPPGRYDLEVNGVTASFTIE